MPADFTSVSGRANADRAWRRTVGQYRRNARARKIPWELTEEDAVSVMRQPCHYCGAPPATPLEHRYRHLPDRRNGLDRVDSRDGYRRGSVVPSCPQCNRAKADLTEAEFRAWLERLARHLRSSGH